MQLPKWTWVGRWDDRLTLTEAGKLLLVGGELVVEEEQPLQPALHPLLPLFPLLPHNQEVAHLLQQQQVAVFVLCTFTPNSLTDDDDVARKKDALIHKLILWSNVHF